MIFSSCTTTTMDSKIDFLFKCVDSHIRCKLQLDDEALYSTTDQVTADKITANLSRFIPSNAVVTDATACAGGNTYSFSKYFSKVYAFEIDTMRERILRHNLAMLGVHNVTVKCGDSMDLCLNQHQDLIFLDPPWGGPNYKQFSKISLFLSGGTHLATFCERIAEAGVVRFIAIKAPINFDETEFIALTSAFMTLRHKNTQLRKMYLYIFECSGGCGAE